MAKYKVGDLVKVKENLQPNKKYGALHFWQGMTSTCGRYFKIQEIRSCGFGADSTIAYQLEDCFFFFTEEMLDPYTSVDIKSKTERIKCVKAMEFLARQLNDEDLLINSWLTDGVADGDIEYGDLNITAKDFESLECYLDDESFGELMCTFLRVMATAVEEGGLYCDRVASERWLS